MLEYSITAKWLELLKEIAPIHDTSCHLYATRPFQSGTGQFGAIQSAAPSLRMDVTPVDVRDARVRSSALSRTFAQSSTAA